MLFKSKAKELFNINDITSEQMRRMIERCESIYKGHPDWVNDEEHIKTINFAKAVCSETARLATLAIGVQIDGSARAKWLQTQIDKIYFQLRRWVEYSGAYGTIILKPNGKSIDIYIPEKFIVTDCRNGEITGVVFVNKEKDEQKKKYYARLEYHRFLENGTYAITNKCYEGASENDVSKTVPIENTPWSGLMEDVTIENVEKPLYGVLCTPHANNIDIDSPLSMPIFADAIEEFKDLDIAYSRNSNEIYDSERISLVDDRLIMGSGKPVKGNVQPDVKLPRYAKMVYGNSAEEFYQEINPILNTDTRLTGINALLSQIGYKCGFSNGYFVFNEKTGLTTATQVEADQQRTIQFIKDVRDKLESCLDDLIYSLNVFADLYNYAPVGEYAVVYDFGDITYSYEEDKANWWKYRIQGDVPPWMYYVRFEGMTEDKARAMIEEAKPDEPSFSWKEE